MGINVGECLQSDQPHELFHLMAAPAEHAAGHETDLDIAAHTKPREQIGILEHETALGARPRDKLCPDAQLAGGWCDQPGNQTQER